MSLKTKLQLALERDIQAYQFSSWEDEKSFAANALAYALVKKLPHASDESHSRAVAAFFERNQPVKVNLLDWPDDTTRQIFSRARGIIHNLLWKPDFYEPDPGNGAFGPGKSHLVTYADICAKYETLTYTDPELLSFFLRAHPWSHPDERAILSALVRSSRRVRGSKLTTVPKNDTIDRCIAIEPSLNMFLQQALRVDLEKALTRVGINLSSQQDIQRSLARQGSIDDKLSTVDLSAASDSISQELVRYLFPDDWNFWLFIARSPNICYRGKYEKLELFATMGNATTFPLQTLIFFALAKAVCQVVGCPTTVGVFGDDIILPKEAYWLLTQVLRHAGFEVNLEKSFREGLFKESCGSDWYKGSNVRPVYIQRLDVEAHFYSAINRLERWCAVWRFPLPETFNVLHSALRKVCKRPLIVPLFESDDAGIHRYISGRYVALRVKPQFRSIHWSDVRLLWLCTGGYVEDDTGSHDLQRSRVAVRPTKYSFYRERCFAPVAAVLDPTYLAAINKRFGLGSRLLGGVA